MIRFLFIAVVCTFSITGYSQNIQKNKVDNAIVLSTLNSLSPKLGLETTDIENASVSNLYQTKHNGVYHSYVQQFVNHLPIINAIIGLHFTANGELTFTTNNFVQSIKTKLITYNLNKTNADLVSIALQKTNTNFSSYQVKEKTYSPSLTFNENEPIFYNACFFKNEKIYSGIMVIFYNNESSDWYNIFVDLNGDIIEQTSWTVHCKNTHIQQSTDNNHSILTKNAIPFSIKRKQAKENATYYAYNFPTMSPLHGKPETLNKIHDTVASPFGWHDMDGVLGAESNKTIGNNTLASEDANRDNIAGYSPDGGSNLQFIYPFSDTIKDPTKYLDFAITNLFVANNLMHDIMYHYGFDEISGNFQKNNYGKGGNQSDHVNADAQDGSGTNNANFSTPPDGTSGRMQMYIWNPPTFATLAVTSPSKFKYQVGTAQFGKVPGPTPVSGKLIFYKDASGEPGKGCSSSTNASLLSGNIAVIKRGDCTFVTKVKNAQNAGAKAAVILDTSAADVLITMSGTDASITIPAVFLKFSNAGDLNEFMATNANVMGTIYDSTTAAGSVKKTDSDLDFSVMAHEFGHGVSTRLTCGPANSNGLTNAEQMGEGWSDYFALALTQKNTDLPTDKKTMGNWLEGQDLTGSGIRTLPYSTDMTVNNLTYNAIKTNTEVHFIGEVWCAMLWDLHWEFVKRYGFSPDFYYGNKGNNKCMQVIVDAMKLQKCNPGFVDGRNAILKADSLNNAAANSDIIWKSFARRGLGYSAKQGSSFNAIDGTQAFDLPGTPSFTKNIVSDKLILIFPNPTTSQFTLAAMSTQSISKVTITDVSGKIIKDFSTNEIHKNQFSINNIPANIYFVNISINGQIITKKLVIL